MGTAKAWLPVGGIPVIERVIAACDEIVDEVVIVGPPQLNSSSRYAALGRVVWPDEIPDRGPLGGLYTAFQKGCRQGAILLSCDMPFITSAFLQFLLDQHPRPDAVIPETAHGIQPLCALYARSCAPAILDALEGDDFSMRALVARLKTRFVKSEDFAALDPDGALLTNLNTPEEYEAALKTAERD